MLGRLSSQRIAQLSAGREDTILKRTLLILELIIFCTPALFFLALGIVFLPVSLGVLLGSVPLESTSGFGEQPLMSLVTIFGIWGAISLAGLVWSTLSNKRQWAGRPIQWFGIALGVISCMIGLTGFRASSLVGFTFVGPLIVTAHFLYLAKANV